MFCDKSCIEKYVNEVALKVAQAMGEDKVACESEVRLSFQKYNSSDKKPFLSQITAPLEVTSKILESRRQ